MYVDLCTHEPRTLFPGGSYCPICATVTAPAGPGYIYDWWKNLNGGANLETLALVARHLAEAGDDARQVAYLLEKPWKFSDEFIAAVRACAPPASRTLLAADPAGTGYAVFHGDKVTGRVVNMPPRYKNYTEKFTASQEALRRTLGLPPTD